MTSFAESDVEQATLDRLGDLANAAALDRADTAPGERAMAQHVRPGRCAARLEKEAAQ